MKKYAIYIILLISILVSVFYGFQKMGFHEDEYYTYFSSNRSLGLYQPDREWQDRQTVLDEFSVESLLICEYATMDWLSSFSHGMFILPFIIIFSTHYVHLCPEALRSGAGS